MPELPDVVVYIEALERRVVGRTLDRVRLVSPFVLRTAVPPIASAEGKRVLALRRIGKRIVLELEDELFLVLHLMIAGRLRWLSPGAKPPGRITLAVFEFPDGSLAFTEAGTKRRASLHLVQGEAALRASTPAGSRCSRPISPRSRSGSGRRTTRSSARSPIRASSAASATPTRTRSCTARGSRPSR